MRLGVNEAVELSLGELQNTPSISYFNSIVLSLNKVQKGSLFVAKDHTLIPKALELGAYGILYAGEYPLSDRDVAWIKLKDIEHSLNHLFKFCLLNERVVGALLSPIELEIASKIMVSNFVWCLKESLEDLFIIEGCKIAFFDKLEWLHLFYKQERLKEDLKESRLIVLNQSFFCSALVYEKQEYELKMPCIFLEPLKRVIQLCEKLQIEFDLNLLGKKEYPLDHCKPFFVNKNLEIAPYGATARVVVAETSKELFEMMLQKALETLSWGKIVVFCHKNSAAFFKKTNHYFYTTQNNLKEQLKNLAFNFAFIYGISSHHLESLLNPPLFKKTPTLW
ncbi:ferrochelatase [Helicobacter pylori]|uniref:Ferrochelatase n=1 Tax=Helicobacter pylori TaxID=210 RepID=A0ABD6QWR3_HELPX|nr:ferrochelatase [Helicobacter pylori]OOQ16378.1 ferrochelatase [Helicobacter pylori]PDX03230.1 ferrochelatase [Helicobacter pylori]WQU61193.1 ferrochelatase [Helicobacter pylori]